ncbi:PspC domain-containing protein, partial [Arthrobacter deserti]|nr:PspC domain-containing protein [Arthrobacter deserti]
LDPVLVRGLFILLAVFGGVGVLLYGAAWALLPEPDGRIHAEEAGRGRWSSGMTGAVAVTALGLFNRPFGVFGFDGEFRGALWALLWAAAVIFVVTWLIGRSRRPGGGPGAGQIPAPGSGAAFPAAPAYPSDGYPAPAGPGGAAAPAAGYGPYLPPPAGYTKARQAKPVRRGPSGPAVAVTLGSAMLLGGLVLALDAAQVLDLGRAVVPVVAAVVLVVLGTGIVAAGVRGRSSGVLGFLAAVGLVAALLTSAGAQWQTSSLAVGTTGSWGTPGGRPAGDGYSVAAGRGVIDLTGLRPGTNGTPAVVPVNAAAASVEVIIPRGAAVEVRSQLAFGNIEYTTARDSGSSPGLWRPATIMHNGSGSGPAPVLQIRGAMSTVDIVEGPAAPEPQG